ncbi:MAG: type I methionyl aminopeptidase [Spirochaetes bacterium]|nr:type I methionyl aminopeptidase [Spirochaetota bacterium]
MNRIVRLKTDDDIRRIADCGLIISRLFRELEGADFEGQSTWELDTFIEDYIMKNRARPAFKTVRGYSFASCISVNAVASHGVPSKKIKILTGDIVKIDTGTVMNGYFADSCSTFIVGDAGEPAKRLVNAAYQALMTGISEIGIGKTVGDVGHAVDSYARSKGYSIVKNFTGHGVGFALHEPPVVPNYGIKGKGAELTEGMVITVEPILTEGSDQLIVMDDGWTSITSDGSLSAQFEHTVAVTKNGPIILTSD